MRTQSNDDVMMVVTFPDEDVDCRRCGYLIPAGDRMLVLSSGKRVHEELCEQWRPTVIDGDGDGGVPDDGPQLSFDLDRPRGHLSVVTDTTAPTRPENRK